MTGHRRGDGEQLLAAQLATANPDLVRQLMSSLIHALMSDDADALCYADYGQRTQGRLNSRNGYRRRSFHTRVGTIELTIPKLRFGTYFPDWLLRRRELAERMLTTMVASCYLLGVSTQRMQRLIESLGMTSLSPSQVSLLSAEFDETIKALRARPLKGTSYPFIAIDALTLTALRQGRVVGVMQSLIATGVNAEGLREILGTQMCSIENEARWVELLRGLTDRGLYGVALVTSDPHTGVQDAVDAMLPGAAWQRCRAHYATEILAITPRSSWTWVRNLLDSIFDQPDVNSVAAQYDRVLDIFNGTLPHLAGHLAAARGELLAYTSFPQQLWRQIWMNNPCMLRQ